MSTGTNDPTELMSQLRHALSALEYPRNFRACMTSAAELVEQAALSITEHTPGNRVAELLFLAARMEELSRSHVQQDATDTSNDAPVKD